MDLWVLDMYVNPPFTLAFSFPPPFSLIFDVHAFSSHGSGFREEGFVMITLHEGSVDMINVENTKRKLN